MIARETAHLLRLITAPLLVIDGTGGIVFTSQSLCELLEKEKSQLVGRPLVELAEDPPEKTSRTLKLFFSGGDWLVGRLSLRKGDGSVMEFPCRGCVIQRPSDHQEPLVAIQLDHHTQFQAVGHKIDELNAEIRLRRQVEEQLRSRSALLEQEIAERKKAEQHVDQLSLRNRLILDSAGEGICGLDIDGRCTFVNPAALQCLGFNAEELIGHHCHHMFHHTKADGSPFPEEECPTHASFKQGAVYRGRELYWRKGGGSFPVESISTPILDAGKIVGSVVTFRDITELKAAENKINELNGALERRVAERTSEHEAAIKELEEFSYSVSHDLRTPLRAIDGFSRILLDEYREKLDDEGKRLLNVVRENTIRMGRLIEDILAFTRIGRVEMAFSRIDMAEMVREVFEELKPRITEAKLQLEIEAMPIAWGDRTMMYRVFANLLSNAVKFSLCKETARINAGGYLEGDEAIYYVKDNGVGFDMRYANKLFGVSQRLHGVAEFKGSGIGLAIVKRIVTRHGGRVWAEAKVNEGAAFYFALPAGKSEPRPESIAIGTTKYRGN